MNGRFGLASWRWVFIFDFIIGLPVVLLGFFCCPGMLLSILSYLESVDGNLWADTDIEK